MNESAQKDKPNTFLGLLKENMHLVTIASIVIPAALCLIAYFLQCIELQAWNIPAELMGTINGGKYFYIVITGLLFYVAAVILPLYLYPRTEKEITIMKMAWFLLATFLRVKIKLREYPDKSVNERLNDCLVKTLSSQKILALLILKPIIYGVPSFILSCVAYYTVLGFGFGNAVAFSVFSASLAVAALYINVKANIGDIIIKLKKRRRESKDDVVALLHICQETTEIILENDKRPRVKLEYEEIKSYILHGLVNTLTMFFVATAIQCFAMQFRHDFWIYNNGEQYYVVVYGNENQVVLDDAKIDGDALVIYTNRQQVLDRNALRLEYKKFDKVEHKETTGSEE